MRKIYLFALLTLVVFAFSSCDGFGGKTPEYHLSDLQGLWQEQKTNAPTEHYVRFTDEQADDEGYFFAANGMKRKMSLKTTYMFMLKIQPETTA